MPSVRMAQARASAGSEASRWKITSSVRPSARSATTPPNRMKTTDGAASAICATPSIVPETLRMFFSM